MPVKMSEAGPCYYSVLGLCKQASDSEIRDAYRKLALKWHPDRWMKDQVAAGQAKRQFQQIQEAYSVLSDKGKKRIYDAGMLGFLGDDDDEGFCDFVQEMVLMMEDVRSKEEGSTLEDLQALLMGMMTEDERVKSGLNWDAFQRARKRTRLSGL
ncbi:chaperone protein DnaJ-like [Populus alba x Populus x berolinensis]|nr:chaperone protein DnaJ-like [Populus alba x Populus x berolinensis]